MSSILFTLVFPTVGTILSNAMYSSSLLVVRLSRRQRFLSKSVNPVPWAMAATNAFAWLIYGVMVSDIFIVTANSLGALVCVFSLTSALALLGASRDAQDWRYVGYMEMITMATIGIWLAIAYTVVITGDTLIGTTLVGYYALICSVLMYSSNMSSIVSIISLRDASFIYLPQAVASGLNAFCWLLYGFFAVNSPTVYVPNMLGALISLILVALKMVLPSKIVLTEVVLSDKGKSAESGSAGRDRAHSAVSIPSSARSEGKEYNGALVESSRPRKMSVDTNNSSNKARSRANSLFNLVNGGNAEFTGLIAGQPIGDIGAPTERGRAATIKALFAPDAPPTIVDMVGKAVDSTLDVVRNRAESFLLMVEDSIITNMAPVLREEVIEAAANLQELQDLEAGPADNTDETGDGADDADATGDSEGAVHDSTARAEGTGLAPIMEQDPPGADMTEL